jgi:zinc protease
MQTPPLPGPVRIPTLPESQERTLPSGLRVIAFQQSTAPKALGVPLIAAQLIARAGAASEENAYAGLAALTAALLTQGTQTHSAVEIAQAIDALGARLDASPGYDATVVSVSATTPAFAQAFALMRDVVCAPTFVESEFTRVREKAIGDLALTYSNPSALARLVANRVAYGERAYGQPLAGTKTTLAALERDDVVRFHARTFRPDASILVIGGDISTDDAFALAEKTFAAWMPSATPPVVITPVVAPPPRSRIVAVDKPDAGRTALLAGRVAIARTSPDFSTATVAMAILSGYSGRLNQEIRVKRGLSYGAGAQLIARRDPGLFLASTLVDHTKVDEATRVVLATLTELGTTPAAARDLERRQAVVLGGFYRGIETTDGIVATLGEFALHGLPLTDLSLFVPRIEAVRAQDVCAFARATIAHDLFVVLVGDASRFVETLRAEYAAVEVIPFADLDLSRGDLIAIS